MDGGARRGAGEVAVQNCRALQATNTAIHRTDKNELIAMRRSNWMRVETCTRTSYRVEPVGVILWGIT